MKETLQDALIQARRDLILDAAAKVFAEKGFHPTTIKDIAKTAGIADGTIYNYFENKTALLLAIFDRMKLAAQQSLDPELLVSLDLRGFLTTLLLHPLTTLKADNFALFRVVMSELLVNQELRTLYRQQILEPTLMMGEAYLQHWITQHPDYQLDPALAMRLISALMMGLLLEAVMGDAALESLWSTLPDSLVDVLMRGLAVRL